MKRFKPYKFQAEDVERIQQFHGRSLIAWEPGLGKTSGAALSWMHKYLARGPVVVVCPAVMKETWRREAWRHFKIRAVVLYGRTPGRHRQLVGGKRSVYIVNYDILGRESQKRRTWIRLLKAIRPRLVVIDECQAIRHQETQRTRAVRALCQGVPHVLALGGTGGLENRPFELFPTLNILRPDLFPSAYTYGQRYCKPEWTPWGFRYNGADHLDELHAILTREVMCRRRKADVLGQLPPRVRTVIPVRLGRDDRDEYDEAEQDFASWLNKHGGSLRSLKAEELTKLGYLKRLVGRMKLPIVSEWIDDFLDSGRKLLVFGVHRAVLRPLLESYRKVAVLVDGSVVGKKRQESIDRFNRDRNTRLFLGNIRAAGAGWSCTSASDVLFAELEWSPGLHTQAESRPHGIGRGVKGRGVQVYYPSVLRTIDDDLCKLNEEKQRNIDQTIDGKITSDGLDIMTRLRQAIRKRVEG